MVSAYEMKDEVKSICRDGLFIKEGIYFWRHYKQTNKQTKKKPSRSNASFFLWHLFLAFRVRLTTINRRDYDQNIPPL